MPRCSGGERDGSTHAPDTGQIKLVFFCIFCHFSVKHDGQVLELA